MSVFTPARFSGPSYLTTSVATQFTVPASTQRVLKQILFNNTSASAATVTVHVVSSGGSAASANAVISTLQVSPNSNLIWSADIPMATGETLQAVASANSAITMTTSGIEIV